MPEVPDWSAICVLDTDIVDALDCASDPVVDDNADDVAVMFNEAEGRLEVGVPSTGGVVGGSGINSVDTNVLAAWVRSGLPLGSTNVIAASV
jgi:hypothetical protein